MDFPGILEYLNNSLGKDFLIIDEELPPETVKVSAQNWNRLASFLREDEQLFF